MRETPLSTSRSEKSKGKEVLQVSSILEPAEKTVGREAVPLQPNAEQISSLQAMENPAAGRHALKGAAVRGELTFELAPGRRCSPWRGTQDAAGIS